MYLYVKERLAGRDIEATYIDRFPFRRRSDHTWRVFKWAEELVQQENLPADVDCEVVLTAAIFHDVGYALKPEMHTHDEHAMYSVKVFEEYAAGHPFATEQKERIAWLIRHHSDKQRMKEPDITLDLLLVMEADIMDETGALGMVWDCLYVGSKTDPSYEKALDHLRQYSGEFLLENPMVTPLARKIWEKKQNLIRDFIEQLEADLWVQKSADLALDSSGVRPLDENTEFLSHFSGLMIPKRAGDFLHDIESVYLSNHRPDTWTHVTKVAVEIGHLAGLFNLDQETCRVCAFCHDLAAILNPNEMLEYARRTGMPLDPAEEKHPFLLHQRFSAILANIILNIDEPEILSAVACHSTLKARASMLDMALFLADKLAWDQPGTPPFTGAVREALEQSLSQACQVYIEYAIDHGMILLPHRQLIEALEWLRSSKYGTNED